MAVNRFLMAAWGIMECLFFGGLIYGWGSLVFVLKDEGIYGDLCLSINSSYVNETSLTNQSVNRATEYESSNNYSSLNVIYVDVTSKTTVTEKVYGSTGLCPDQDDMLNLVFTVASSLFCIGCAVLGMIHYVYGTRIARITSMLSFAVGTITIAQTSADYPWLIFIGLSCLGIGGIPILMTNAQISYLFQNGGIYVSCLSGAYDSSVIMVLAVKIIYENGIAKKYSFYFLCGLHVLVAISTFLFLPKGHIKKSASETEEEHEMVSQSKEKVAGYRNNLKDLKLKKKSTKVSLKECIMSSKFILHVMWVSLLQLRFYYFLGTLNPWLNKIFDGNKAEVSHFTDVSFYIMLGGFVFAFTCGGIYDCQMKVYDKHPVPIIRTLRPAVVPLIVTCTFSVLLSILVLIPDTNILYLTFITLAIFRSSLYSTFAAYISIIFPGEYFGSLYGLGIIVAGITSFLQNALFTWSSAYEGALAHVNGFLLCVSAISFVHPLFQFMTCRRALQDVRKPDHLMT